MKQLLTILCMCLVFTSTAQTAKTILSPATPASAGFSDERLKRIDKKIQDWIDAKLVNGGVAFIAREGKIVYNKSFGYADMEKKIPMRTDHIFRIASQTKAITSLAILILLEEGKLTLDDPVSRYIPEFAKPQVVTKFNLSDTTWTSEPAKREITIKDLITHTSGIGYAQIGTPEAQALYKKYGITAGLGVGGHSLSTDMRKLGKLPLFSNPGEKWTYSLGDDVLGLVVEVISGMNLEQFFRTKIFDPLGMNDTWFYLPKDKHSRLVKLYTHDSTGMKPFPAQDDILGEKVYVDFPNENLGYYSGGGGLSSTVKDYAIFLQMLLNGGTYNGKQILSHNTVRMMLSNQFKEDQPGMIPFGLGFGINTLFGSAGTPKNEGTFEWGGAFGTQYWVDPKEKIVALIYFNKLPLVAPSSPSFEILTYQALTND